MFTSTIESPNIRFTYFEIIAIIVINYGKLIPCIISSSDNVICTLLYYTYC